MTLAGVPPYDPEAVSAVGTHAVVVGGSIGGLIAARVLADGYERVTLLERDAMPEAAVTRRGVPQSHHVHVMLEPGRVILNDLFPGYEAELSEAGGLVLDAATELDYFDQGDFLAAPSSEFPTPCASRPLFEDLVRRRVANTDGVQLRGRCHVTEYVTDADTESVEGVTFRTDAGTEETLLSDLVVDATGRTSNTHQWLTAHDYDSPAVDRVDVDLAYATVTVERPEDAREAHICVPSVPDAKGGTVIPIEDGRWIVTLFRMHGDHPPTDREGFLEFAGSLPESTIADLLVAQEWTSDEVAYYPFSASQWRHYEDLDRFPDGLVVTGDAIASFNPIYGQGMSAAALDGLQLHHTLAAGDSEVGPRFFDRAASHLDVVWQVAVGADFEFEETTGPKPFGADLFNRYVSRLIDTAHDDRRVAEAFTRVLRLEARPTTLFHPRIAARVVLPS